MTVMLVLAVPFVFLAYRQAREEDWGSAAFAGAMVLACVLLALGGKS